MMVDASSGIWTPPVPAVPAVVKLVVISECAANDARDNYGASSESLFDRTTLDAFAGGGLERDSLADLQDLGIHFTVVLRTPRNGAKVDAAMIRRAIPTLAAELEQFPNARAYLLMGDVAIGAINQIARERTGKRAIPAGSTYRIRGGDFRLGEIRLFPSYLQAGPAWYIEASKRRMVAEDIAAALDLVGIQASQG